MNKNDEIFIKELIYNKSKREVLKELEVMEDADILHIFMKNYNWDDGFEIPKKVISKKNCELSTALMIFYMAEGDRYLENKNSVLVEWSTFIQELYDQIMNNHFKEGNILFIPPFSRVQLYKIKKILNEDEQIFIKEIGERNLDILL